MTSRIVRDIEGSGFGELHRYGYPRDRTDIAGDALIHSGTVC